MEKLVECPACHQKQLENKSDYCSFCYTNFKDNQVTEKSHKTDLTKNQNNNLFNISEKNKKLLLVAFFLNIIVMVILSTTLLSSSQIRFFILTLMIDIFSAAILGLLVINNKQNTIKAFKIFIACFLASPSLIIFTNFVLSYPAKNYKVDVIRKYSSSGKNGRSYWLEVSNWKNSSEKIKIKYDLWQDIEEGSHHILRVKKGGLGLDIYLKFF